MQPSYPGKRCKCDEWRALQFELNCTSDTPFQCSQQAVQPRSGLLGLSWLAGSVGLVLAPSRLGRKTLGRKEIEFDYTKHCIVYPGFSSRWVPQKWGRVAGSMHPWPSMAETSSNLGLAFAGGGRAGAFEAMTDPYRELLLLLPIVELQLPVHVSRPPLKLGILHTMSSEIVRTLARIPHNIHRPCLSWPVPALFDSCRRHPRRCNARELTHHVPSNP